MNARVELPDEVVEAIAQRAAEIVGAVSEISDAQGYLDVDGAAEFLACKPGRIYSLTSLGRIPVHRDGTRLLFLPAELRAYVAAGGAKRP